MPAGRRPTVVAIFWLTASLSPCAATGAENVDCQTVYGTGMDHDPYVATAIARRDAERKARDIGRGAIVSHYVNRQRVGWFPTVWRVYYGARVCRVRQRFAPRRIGVALHEAHPQRQ